jgi:hypothetical protein
MSFYFKMRRFLPLAGKAPVLWIAEKFDEFEGLRADLPSGYRTGLSGFGSICTVAVMPWTSRTPSGT